MYCSKCGAQNEDASKFCMGCGTPLENAAVPQSDTVSEAEIKENDAVTFDNNVVENNEEVANQNNIPHESAFAYQQGEQVVANKKKIPVKLLVIGALIVAVLGTAIFFGAKWIMGFFGSNSDTDEKYAYLNEPILYYKGDSIHMIGTGKTEGYEVANAIGFGSQKFTNDGSKMFFIYKGDLYYRNTNQKTPKGDNADDIGIKIDSDVSDFEITKNGDKVAYIRNGKLYTSTLKGDPQSVASDVSDFTLSESGKTLMYSKNNGSVYTHTIGKNNESVKVDSELVGGLSAVTTLGDDFDKIYYSKDETLYLKEANKDRVKIEEGITQSGIRKYDDQMFIYKVVDKKYKFDDFVDDDCKEEDEKIERPEYDDYRLLDDDGDYEYDDEAYDKDYEIFREKEQRDYLREYAKDYEKEVRSFTLYKLDGTKLTEIATNIKNDMSLQFPVKGVDVSIEKIKMSELKDSSDFYSRVNDMFSSSSYYDGEKMLLKSDGKLIDFPEGFTTTYFDVTDDFKYMYTMEDGDGDYETRVVYRYTVTDKGFTDKKEIARNVSTFKILDGENKVLVFHSQKGDSAIGYYDGNNYEKISDNVREGHVKYVKGDVYYIADYNDMSMGGTLIKWTNGKNKVISEDVFEYEVRRNDDCYYLKDFSPLRYSGDLYINGNKKPIDEGVRSFY